MRYVKCLFIKIQKQQNVLKISLLFRKVQTLRTNNSRILIVKNAELSGYCFYNNANIQGDFQICISVPLIILLCSKQSYTYLNNQSNIDKSTNMREIILGIFKIQNANIMTKITIDPNLHRVYYAIQFLSYKKWTFLEWPAFPRAGLQQNDIMNTSI